MAALVPDVPQVEATIVALTNQFRRENKLADVRPNPVLAVAARAFADYLARTGQFSHTADGRKPAERIRAAGYAYCDFAENLARHQSAQGFETSALARHVVEGWKGSPGHRQNMLQPHVTETGVAVARSADGAYLSVQLFGQPESLKYQFRIENLSPATIEFNVAGKQNTLQPRVTLRLGQCQPVAVSIESVKMNGSDRRIDARFEPKNGDAIKVTGDALSSIRVELGR